MDALWKKQQQQWTRSEKSLALAFFSHAGRFAKSSNKTVCTAHFVSVKQNSKKLLSIGGEILYSGNLVDCGPCKRLCVPTKYLLEEEEDKEQHAVRRTEINGSTRRLDPLEELGSRLMQEVFSWLRSADLAKCLAVSKSWKSCAVHDFVWKKRCEKLSRGSTTFLWRPTISKYVLYRVLVRDVQQQQASWPTSLEEHVGASTCSQFKEEVAKGVRSYVIW